MALLSYRYLEDLGNTLETMQRAMTLRGFDHHRLNRRNLNKIAGLVGTLLVRSYEQSQRIYQAMILRGYGHSVVNHRYHSSHPRSLIGAILAIAIAVFLLVAQFSLG
jgi:cobalt/nickel transport system permease protein